MHRRPRGVLGSCGLAPFYLTRDMSPRLTVDGDGLRAIR